MNDLAAWLREQLDEDERVARWALSDQAEHAADDPNLDPAWWWNEPDADSGAEHHISRWRPERVLAEVDAKRRLIDFLVAWLERDVAPWNMEALRVLALPYADRDGFREEWRP